MYFEWSTADSPPADWLPLQTANPYYAVTTRWLKTMGPPMPGAPNWLVAYEYGSPQIGVHARVLHGPPPEPRYDIAAILRGDIPSYGPRPGSSTSQPIEALYPAVAVVLPGYTCAVAGPGAHDPNLLRRTLSVVLDWAVRCDARSISFLYVPERHQVLRRCLTELGAEPGQLFPTCILSLPATDMDEYLGGLPRPSRKGLKRLLRRCAEGGLTLEESDLTQVREEVIDLRLALLRKYGTAANRAVETEAVDRMILHYQPEERVLATIRRQGEVVGFTLSLRHEDTMRAIWTGRRPEVNGSYYLTMFYESVAAALRRGVATIDYGTLKWHEKISYGCRLEHLSRFTWTL